jgi:Lrp/AsnC family transcriptional regulator, cysteine-sensing transcriptional activator
MIDDADRRILRELQRDSSRPVAQIADLVGLSHAACWRRMQRLRGEGYVEREVAVLGRSKIGWELEVFVFVKVSAQGRANIEEVRRWITDHEQVVGTYVLMGNVDMMLHVVARNIRDYRQFFTEHLAASPYLSEINSMSVMATLKEADLPV